MYSLTGNESVDNFNSDESCGSNEDIINQISEVITKNIVPLEHEEKNRISIGPGLYLPGPNQEQYDKYNDEVNSYNEAIQPYFSDINEYVSMVSSFFDINFRITNEGTAPATEVILRIEIEDLHYCNDLPQMPEKPVEPSKPYNPYDFIAGNVGSSLYPATILDKLIDKSKEKVDSKVKVDIDNGKKFINIFIGKVLQHTHRDYKLKYLYSNKNDIKIKYQLIYEQSTYPEEGVFFINLIKDNFVHPDVLNYVREETK
jgi:hypothetical protein